MDRIFKKVDEGKKLLIIGIGNRLKGDDGVGSIIAGELKKRIKKENVFIIDAENRPENYIGVIKKINPDLILIIDAFDFGSYPSDFRIFTPDRIRETTISTHNLSIPLLIKLVEVKEIFLLGIQPKNINFGEDLSPELINAVNKIIDIFQQKF